MSLDQQVMQPPFKPINGQRGYNCHGAAIYWAARANGLAQDRAYALYSRIAEHYNGQLGNNNATASILSGGYGDTFCRVGVKLTTPALNPAEYSVGDVIFTEHPSHPMHSMIVVAVSVPLNKIEVRGYNNNATFSTDNPLPPRDAYDNHTRSLATRVYQNVPLYRIPENTFCLKVKSVAIVLGFRA
jgi:hypothetical protein